MKSDTDSSDPKYYIAKLLMYGLFWRFGLNPDNNIVEITTPPRGGGPGKCDEIIANEYAPLEVKITPLDSRNVRVSCVNNNDDLKITNI